MQCVCFVAMTRPNLIFKKNFALIGRIVRLVIFRKSVPFTRYFKMSLRESHTSPSVFGSLSP